MFYRRRALLPLLGFLSALPGRASQLPSFPARRAGISAAVVPDRSTWLAAVGERVYYTPSSTDSLSQHIGDYYYAAGSASALTDEMRRYRVGGDGQWHIFHLPEGPSSLADMPLNGDRRSSFSSLMQLTNRVITNQPGKLAADDAFPIAGFPRWDRNQSYVHPLSSQGQAVETRAIDLLNQESYRRYLQNITQISDGKDATRSALNRVASQAAQQYLKAQFESMGLITCVQTFNKDRANIIGFLPGQGVDTVTLGAHYDSRPYEGKASGANDNGSGVAAMLAVAKALTDAQVKPSRNIYFVGFAAEETGLEGSEVFAEDLSANLEGIPRACRIQRTFLQKSKTPHHRAIVVDEVGWVSNKFNKPFVNVETYDWASGVMEELGQSSLAHNGELPVVIHNSAPFGSDHMSFLKRNIPAALVINADDEGYPGYHKATDTIDKVDVGYATTISKMVLGALMRMAGARPEIARS